MKRVRGHTVISSEIGTDSDPGCWNTVLLSIFNTSAIHCGT
ncbi:hypothetical protein [Granulicella mallensis]|nr:hypothetical protein [Granulicella mallensis]